MILDVPDRFVEVLRRLEGLTPRRTEERRKENLSAQSSSIIQPPRSSQIRKKGSGGAEEEARPAERDHSQSEEGLLRDQHAERRQMQN